MPRLQRSQFSRGFSFHEVLVVISLIAMALIVAIPAIGEYIRMAKVRTSADQFTTTLRAARMISVAERRPVEVRLVPGPALHHLGQEAHGVPDVDEAEVGRRESETQQIGSSEIADDTSCDQGLHDRVSFWVSERHLASSSISVEW